MTSEQSELRGRVLEYIKDRDRVSIAEVQLVFSESYTAIRRLFNGLISEWILKAPDDGNEFLVNVRLLSPTEVDEETARRMGDNIPFEAGRTYNQIWSDTKVKREINPEWVDYLIGEGMIFEFCGRYFNAWCENATLQFSRQFERRFGMGNGDGHRMTLADYMRRRNGENGGND